MINNEITPGSSEASPTDGEMLNLGLMIESMRSGRLEVVKDGTPLEIGEILGEGGSKTVRSTSLNNESLAIALPNTTDDEAKVFKKWEIVLKEPASTDKIRAMGVPVNPMCETTTVEVNGVPFKALLMKPYTETGFEVRDSKNRRSSVIETDLLPKAFGTDNVDEVLSDVLDDVATLINNGVTLGRDSFNICKKDGKLRLYLNDLGTAGFGGIPNESQRQYIESYVANALDSVGNGVNEEEWMAHKEVLESDDISSFHKGAIFSRLVEAVQSRLNVPT